MTIASVKSLDKNTLQDQNSEKNPVIMEGGPQTSWERSQVVEARPFVFVLGQQRKRKAAEQIESQNVRAAGDAEAYKMSFARAKAN